ncbi:hypothetical protein [Streptomyces sp. bgisy031]|uniref:sialidase family protein n=1 Tax=Streptomyces sp. bgisy031 TaxID=3413772 RepID=UPI003D746D3D
MRVFLPLTAVTTAALLLGTVTGAAPATADRNPDGTRLVKVSHGDPYARCTIGARSPDSIVYPATEVEPYLSVDPRNPKRVVTVFQQDRWNDGGARGLAAGWTADGHTFHRSTLPFSLCAPGGADFERATDPWVSTGPDGIVYASGEGVDFTKSTRTGLLAVTSRDGGRTWRNLTTTHVDEQPFFNDKPSLTADPIRKGTAYQVWNRLDNDPPRPSSLDGPGYISLTRDGGRTWSEARRFVDTSAVPNTQTIGHLIVVDRRTGTLYDFFDRITYADDLSTVLEARYEVVTSTDAGETWSAPVTVARDTSVPEVDPNDPTKLLRAASTLPSPAVDPKTGTLYMAYELGLLRRQVRLHPAGALHRPRTHLGDPEADQPQERTGLLPVDRGRRAGHGRAHVLRPALPQARQHHHPAHRLPTGHAAARKREAPDRTTDLAGLRLAAGAVRRGLLPRRLPRPGGRRQGSTCGAHRDPLRRTTKPYGRVHQQSPHPLIDADTVDRPERRRLKEQQLC